VESPPRSTSPCVAFPPRRSTGRSERSTPRRPLTAAQAEVASLTERCATHEKNLESITRAKEEAERAETRDRAIAGALSPLNPIDASLCATLLERDLAPDADASALAESIGPLAARLASERPYLFRSPTPGRPTHGATMAGEPGAPAHSPIDDAMEEARASGGRTQLLRYLRLRRGA
jgi:hypothetical protein